MRVMTVTRVLLLLIVAMAAVLFGCGEPERHVVVFLEARTNEQVNTAIMEQFVVPIFDAVDSSKKPYKLDIYPISGNTEASRAIFSTAVRSGAMKGRDRKAARSELVRFIEERRIDQVYSDEGSELVDVLGTIRVLDGILGTKGSKGHGAYVIYVSDMVQSDGMDGYDFAGFTGGKSLEDCQGNFQREYVAGLRHVERFSQLKVLVMRVDFTTQYRMIGTATAPAPLNRSDIDDFWYDVFKNKLKSTYDLSASGDALGLVQAFLGS